MEIQDIRRKRLAELIAVKYGASQSRFVDETGENQGEVSALLRNKSFGEKKARKIEEKCGLPAGWMDRELPPAEIHEGRIGADDPNDMDMPVRVIESINQSRASLVYVTADEVDLLTQFRQATELGKGIILLAAQTAEKRSTHLAGYKA